MNTNVEMTKDVEVFNISNFLREDANSMSPSCAEHKMVLVPRAFVEGIKANFQRELDRQRAGLLGAQQPISVQLQQAEIPKIDVVAEMAKMTPTSEAVLPSYKITAEPVVNNVAAVVPFNQITVDEEEEAEGTEGTDGLSKIWGQFDNPFAIVTELEHTMKSLANVVGVLNEQRHTLDMFSKELFSKEASLTNREKSISDKERTLKTEEHELNTRASSITEKEIANAMKAKNLASFEKQLNNDKLALAEQVSKLRNEKIMLDNGFFDIAERVKALDLREEKLEKYKAEQENLIKIKFAEMNRAKDTMEQMITKFIGDISNKDNGIVPLTTTSNEKVLEMTFVA